MVLTLLKVKRLVFKTLHTKTIIKKAHGIAKKKQKVDTEFTLRQWKTTDIESVVYNANNKKVAQKLRNVFPNPYTQADAEFYINMCINADSSKNLCLAIDVDGKAVGSIGIFVQGDVYCKSGELGYWLGEDYWNKGIMTRAIKQICEMAFEKFDIVRIFAEPYSHNIGSKRVLEKSGFKYEGTMKKGVFKNGEIHDFCMYALTK